MKELLNIELSKQMQSSDWGAETLTEQQVNYAASDVLYLHKIKVELDKILIREKRMELAEHCFNFLKHRVTLDLAGWNNQDIFAHQMIQNQKIKFAKEVIFQEINALKKLSKS